MHSPNVFANFGPFQKPPGFFCPLGVWAQHGTWGLLPGPCGVWAVLASRKKAFFFSKACSPANNGLQLFPARVAKALHAHYGLAFAKAGVLRYFRKAFHAPVWQGIYLGVERGKH